MPLFGPPNVEKLLDRRDVKGLIKALGYQKDRRVRWTAAEALGQIGDARAVKPLSAALKDRIKYVGQAAAGALGQIGDARAVEALSAVLGDWEERERVGQATVEALGQISDARAVEALTAALKYEDTRQVAAKLLVKIGKPAVEPLCAALKDTHGDACQAAAKALGQIRSARAVEPLIAALKYGDGGQVAAEALVKIGAPAVGPLVAALKDKDTNVREAAAEVLGRLGWQPAQGEAGAAYWVTSRQWDRCVEIGAPAVKPLIAALGDKIVHEAVAEALVKIGAPAAEPLVATLKDANEDVRRAAAKALVKIGAPAVKSLSAALKDANEDVRQAAARALGEIGDARAVEPLSAALQDATMYVRLYAATALGQIGDARAVAPLVAALRDKDGNVRHAAAETLDQLGWRPDQNEAGATYWVARWQWDRCVEIGAPAVEPLSAALKDANNIVRHAAAGALGEIGDARAVESLVTALKDKDENVRRAAAGALGEIGDARAVEPLRAALQDANRDVCLAAIAALDRLGWQPDQGEAGAAYWVARRQWDRCVEIGTPAVKPLSAALQDRDEDVRCGAAGALVQLGVQLEDVALQVQAVVHLINTLDHGSWPVRRAAAEMLVNLHRTGCLDEQVKQRILAQRERMAISHTDISGGRRDLGTQRYDHGDRSCYVHDDQNVPHQDSGIGVIL